MTPPPRPPSPRRGEGEKKELPQDWQLLKLGDLGQLYCGQSSPVGEVNTQGKGTLYVTGPEQWNGQHIEKTKWTLKPKRLVPAGTIFVTVKGAGVGKLFPGIACAIGRDVYAYHPNADFDFRFSYFALRHTINQVVSQAQGDIPGLSRHHIMDHSVVFPPLATQQAIVAKIEELFSELDKGIESIKLAQQQLKTYRQSVLKAAFEGRLTGAAVSEGELPAGWKWVKLGDACDSVEYGSATKSKETGKIPVLRMGNIQNGRFDWDDLVYTSDAAEIKKYLLKKNDVLFNRTNSAELVGKTAIYKGEQPAIFAGYLIRINYKEDLLDGDYLTYYLNTRAAKTYGNSVRSFGVNQSNINGTKLKGYPLPLPPLAEQQAIVAAIESRLSVADQLEATLAQSLQQAEALRQSVLKQAFEGRLV